MASLGSFGVAIRQHADDYEPDTFEFCGETFTVAEQVGFIPLGMFAKAAASELDTAEMEGLAAMVDLLSSVVVDEDRQRFLDLAARRRAGADDLMPIVQAVIQAQSGNPTELPSDSSDGQSITGTISPAPSSSAATQSQPVQERGRMRHIPGDPRAEGMVSIEQGALQLLTG